MKKVIQSVFSLVLIFAVMVACLSFAPVSQAVTTDTIKIKTESKNVQPGETFTVDISITDNPGIVSMRLFVEYDAQVLTLVDVEDKGVLGTSQFSETLGNPYILVWHNGIATENYTYEGVIATLTFTASDSIERNAVATVSVSAKSVNDIMGVDSSTLIPVAVTPTFENGTVQVLPFYFANASITMYDGIALNFKVRQELFTELGYSDPYVVFVFNGREYTVNEYTVSGNQYSFTFNDIGPKQLKEVITATLYATKGGSKKSSVPIDFSAASYCYGMLEYYNSDAYSELRTLLVDLLNFGSAVQIYTGYKTDNLANSDLTPLQQSWATQTEPSLASDKNAEYKVIDNPTVNWTGAGLDLHDTVKMRFKISANSTEGLRVKVQSAKNGQVWYIDEQDFVPTTDGYYIYFNGFKSTQMREVVYVTVLSGEIAVSNTLSYDIESYAFDVKNQTSEEYDSLKPVTNAMMKYADSAYNYVY